MGKTDRRSSKRHVRLVGVLVLSAAVCMLFSNISHEGAEARLVEEKSSYIVMLADNFQIIDGKNIDLPLPMASTTKIMTALLTVENCRMEDEVAVPEEAVGIEGSSIFLKKGEKMTVRDLLYGLMLRSGNDAAVTLAVHTAGSVDNFVEMMNSRAESMGLKNTRFENPHGLHDENHYTSAYDLCKLGCIAIKNSLFKAVVSTKYISAGEGENRRYWKNKNRILTEYEGGNGIKTGYTVKAGRCLVASAERNGVTAVSVVLNCPDMFERSKILLDEVFLDRTP